MIKKLPESFKSVISQNNGLNMYLSNLTKEVPHTERSWLYEDVKDPQNILDQWMSKLETLKDGDTFEKEVFQFDTSQLEKWGPQGGHPPVSKVLDETVMPTFKTDSPQFSLQSNQVWRNAVDEVHIAYKQMGIRMLRPASYSNVVVDMRARDTLESNSGWPDFTRRNKPEVIKAAVAAATNGEYKGYPAILLFRYYNRKLRMVWMFPMATNLVEGSYFQPLQSSLINSNYAFFAPWRGFEHVRDLVTKAYDNGLYVYASDFSSTDEHFRAASTNEVFNCIGKLFQRQYQSGLMQSLQHMHEIPLIIGPDQMVVGEHGVSSGSNWTNFVETIFDNCFATYVHKNTGVAGLYAIGDDMAWISNKFNEGFREELTGFGEEAGQVIKAEKTNVYPDKVKTLQRLFQRGYRRPDGKLRAVYPTVRALNSSVFPERFHRKKDGYNSDMFCARQFMILENCVDHPLFEEFVKFVCDGNEHLIPFAKQSEQKLNSITRQSKLVPGLNPTYNQEKRDSSLANFKSISVARSF